jgi:hypothetical protein
MIKKRHLFVRNAVAIFAATPLLWMAPSVSAQSSSPSSQESRTSPNSDITRQELARFDQFLDGHQEIAQQLRRDPSLVNDHNYVQGHPELQTFLQDHPGVREEIKENPNYFMRQENRYDRREDANRDDARRIDNRDNDVRQDRDRDADRDADRQDSGRRAQLAQFDRFLDSHRETAEQLRRDPSLVKNQQFLQTHPALQTYLQQHPDIQQRLDQNPNAFMRQENRFDNNERDVDARSRDFDGNDARRNNDRDDARARDNDRRDSDARNRDADNRTDARNNNADRDVRDRNDRDDARARDNDRRDSDARNRDADNRTDARNNNADPDVRDRNDNDMRDRNDRDRDNGYRADNNARQDARNRDHGQVASFDQFLDKHREIAEQLRRDPSLAKNQQFVNNHPALQAYLQDHQGVRAQLYQNPNAFMQQEKAYDSRENGMGRSGMNREQYSFGQFLGTHSDISGQLSKDSSLLKNREYMSSHPELQAYMKTHPDAQSQMAKDPDSFLKASQQFSSSKTGTGTSTTTGTTGTVKTTTPDATKPAEAPKPPKQ